MRPCEVAVVSAGIVGAATAFELQQRGVDVAMLDRAAQLFPGLRGLPVAAAWAGLRPCCPTTCPRSARRARSRSSRSCLTASPLNDGGPGVFPGPPCRLLKGRTPSAPFYLRTWDPQAFLHALGRERAPQKRATTAREAPTPKLVGLNPVCAQDASDGLCVGVVR